MTFSSKLLNYIEPYKIGKNVKTKFFTEHNNNYTIGSYLYIIGGNYDIDTVNSKGYKILDVDLKNNSFVLDIEYSGVLPYNEINLDELTAIYVVDSNDKLVYEIADNSFNFYQEGGKKYSIQNNAIFLSKLTSLNNTTAPYTYNRFFKTYEKPIYYNNYLNSNGYLYSSTSSYINLLSAPTGLTISYVQNGFSDFGVVYDISVASYNTKTGERSLFSPVINNNTDADDLNISFNQSANANAYIIKFSYLGTITYFTTLNTSNNIFSSAPTDIYDDNYNLEFNNISDLLILDNYTKFGSTSSLYAVDKGTTYSNIWTHHYTQPHFNSVVQTISGTYYAITTSTNTQIPLVGSDYEYGLPIGTSYIYSENYDINSNFVMSHTQGGFKSTTFPYIGVDNGDLLTNNGVFTLCDTYYNTNFMNSILYSYGFQGTKINTIDLFLDYPSISSGDVKVRIYGYKYNKYAYGKFNNVSLNINTFNQYTTKPVLLYSGGNSISYNSTNTFSLTNIDNYNIYEINLEFLSTFTPYDGIVLKSLKLYSTEVKTINNLSKASFSNISSFRTLNNSDSLNYITTPLDNKALYILPITTNGISDVSTPNINKYFKLNYGFNYIEKNSSVGLDIPIIVQGDVIPINKVTTNIKNITESIYQTTLLHGNNGLYALSNDKENSLTYSSFFGLNIDYDKTISLGIGTFSITYDSQFVKSVNIPLGYTATYTTDNLYGTYFDQLSLKWDNYIISTDNGLYNLYLNFSPDTNTVKLSDKHRIYLSRISVNTPTIPIGDLIRTISKIDYNNKTYYIGGNKGGGNGYASIINIGTSSSLPFTYNTTGLTLSSASYDSQIDIFKFTYNSNGIVYYSNKSKIPYTINTTNNVTLGNKLPSNNISKVVNYYNGYTNFEFNATDKGIYRLTNINSYAYDYYYPVDVDNGFTDLNSNINRNNNIYIMNDFEYNGDYYIKGYVYKYNYNIRKWVIDNSYITPYMSINNIKSASFSKITWNDGIFGDLNKKNILDGNDNIFKNGIYINSKLKNINITSNSDKEKVFIYNKLKNNNISTFNDNQNNGGYGYNEIINSDILNNVSISNGIISNSNIGYTVSNNTYLNSLYSLYTTYSTIDILKSKISNSRLYSLNINNSELNGSQLYNSYITNANIISSSFKSSYINKSFINNKGDIKIVDYDIWTNLIVDDTNSNNVGLVYIYKFYIDEADIAKLNYGDSISISNISCSKKLNYLNMVKNHINSGSSTNGFYTTKYEDIETLKIYEHDILVSIRKSNLNTTKTLVKNDLSDVDLINNTKMYASIDISYVRYFPKSTTLTEILSDIDYYFTINDVKNSYITKNVLDTTFIDNNTIEYISEIQDESLLINTIDNNLNMKLTSTSSISVTISNNLDISSIKIGDIVNLNNIYHNSQFINNYFTINTYSGKNITLGATVINNNVFNAATAFNQFSTFSATIAKNIYLTKNTYKYNNINSGIFTSTNLLSNNFIGSDSTYIFNNIQTNDNNIYSSNSTQFRAYIVSSSISNANYENSILYKTKANNIKTNKTAIIVSTVSGIINNSNINTIIPSLGTVSYAALFINSNFVNGTISKSDFIASTFSNGKFNDSLFISSLFIKGDVNNSKMISGLINDVSFNSGIIGYDKKYVGNINYEKYKKYSKIYLTQSGMTVSGTINGGIISSAIFNDYVYNHSTEDITPIFSITHSITTTFINGVFNNGLIIEQVNWKNGIFNNGDFQSNYGDSFTSYSWENGYFNGGKFGNGTLSRTSWKHGIFSGGIFVGKVWNDGIFIKGNFIGCGLVTYSGINNKLLHGATDPQRFINIYNNGDYYGLWRNGKVLSTLQDNTHLTNSINNTIQIDKFKSNNNKLAVFSNMLWARGVFENNNGVFENSVFLSGQFNDGEFKYSSFNPFVERKNYNVSNSTAVWSFDISTHSVWNNGKFNKSVFFMSEFNNGIILGGVNDLTGINDQNYGVLIGAFVKNATSYYVNAYNTIWKNGNWKNGNWYGASFANDMSTIPALEYLTSYNYGLTHSQNKLYQYSLIKNYERYNDINSISNVGTITRRPFVWNSMSIISNNIPFSYTGSWNSDLKNVAPSGILSTTISDTIIGTLGYASTFSQVIHSGNIGSVSYSKRQYSTITGIDYYLINTSSVDTNDTSTILLTPTLNFGLTYGSIIEFKIATVSVSPYTSIRFYYEQTPNNYTQLNNTSYASGDVAVIITPKTFLLSWYDNIPLQPKIKIEVSNYLQNITSGVYNGLILNGVNINIAYQFYSSINVASYSIFNNTFSGTVSWSKVENNNNATVSYYAFSSYSYSVATISIPTDIHSYQTTYNGKNGLIYTQMGNGAIIGDINWENGVWNSGVNKFNSFDSKNNTIIADQVLSSYRDKDIWVIKIGIPKTSINEISNSYLNLIDLFKDENSILSVGGQTSILSDIKISISNLSLLDINGNKKYINDIVIAKLDLKTEKRVINNNDLIVTNFMNNDYYSMTIYYKDTNNIGVSVVKSSDRHYIYASKKIFNNLQANNGIFEGVYNNIITNGFPYTLVFENSHFNNAVYKGGTFKSNLKTYAGIGYTTTASVANTNTVFETGVVEFIASNQEPQLYPNNKVSTGLIQNMTFYDGLVLDNNGRLPKIYATAKSYEYGYNYTSFIDAVWDDSKVASIYDKDLAEWKGFYRGYASGQGVRSNNLTGSNVPVGEITYDVLNSISYINFEKGMKIFNSTASGYVYGDKTTRILKLGVNTKEVELLNNNFLSAPNVNQANPSNTVTYSLSEYNMIAWLNDPITSNTYPNIGTTSLVINNNGLDLSNYNNISIGGLTAYNGSKYQKIYIEFIKSTPISTTISYNSSTTKYVQLDLGYNLYATPSLIPFSSYTGSTNLITNNILLNGNGIKNVATLYINNNENIYRNQLFLKIKNNDGISIQKIKVTEQESIPFFNIFTHRANTSGGLSWSNINSGRSIYKNIAIPNSDVSNDLRITNNQ